MVKKRMTYYKFNKDESGVVGIKMKIDLKKYHERFSTEDLEVAYQGFRENYRMYDLPEYFCIANNCIQKFLDGAEERNIDRSRYYHPYTNMIAGEEHNIGTNKVAIKPYSFEEEIMDRICTIQRTFFKEI